MNPWIQGAFKWGMLTYLAILPMAGTIALRNLILLLLLLILLVWLLRGGPGEADARGGWRSIPLSLWLWVGFLLLFPLWAVEPEVALSNLKGQWGESLVAWAVGLGAVFMLGRRGPSLSELAGASAFLVGLHLFLTFMAWAGLFGAFSTNFLSWGEMGTALRQTFAHDSSASWHWQGFPWGFRGFDPMHGNLGYTASQAVVFLVVLAFAAWRAQRVGCAVMAVLAVGGCLLSIVIASSRGAVLYTLLLLALAGAVYLMRLRTGRIGETGAAGGARGFLWGVAAVALVVGAALFQTAHQDARWRTLIDKARAGFLIEEPVKFLCEGLGPDEQQRLLARLGITEPARAEQIIDGLGSDGGRIVLMRVGLDMLRLQPLGLDGSRQSYKKIMAARCGHAPAFDFAHTHQAWIDTALALGWGGMALFAVLLGGLLVAGWRSLDRRAEEGWAFALVLLSAFWILRGLADSVYREHYLQMQALLLGYVFGRMRLARTETAVI